MSIIKDLKIEFKNWNPAFEIMFTPIEWSLKPKFNNNSRVYMIDWLCFEITYWNIN